MSIKKIMFLTSSGFILLALPFGVMLYLLSNKWLGISFANTWLLIFSLCVYQYYNQNAEYLIGSFVFNFIFIKLIEEKLRDVACVPPILVTANIAYVIFVKQFVDGLYVVGISYFTFQQIAFILDIKKNNAEKVRFLNYALFVSFFPQISSGPISRSAELIPQFTRKIASRWLLNVLVGTAIFSIGYFKKVVIADHLSEITYREFVKADNASIDMIGAWVGALAFALQLYFDFSGYSDMVIGVARCFGIRLPFNFLSPYKATSSIEFWSRWHISVTKLFTDHIFPRIAIHLARYSLKKRYGKVGYFLMSVVVPIVLTWTLSGLWHGATMNFFLMGLLFGVSLVVNRMWRVWNFSAMPLALGWLLTFVSNVVIMVFFRSNSATTAINIIFSMFGFCNVGGELFKADFEVFLHLIQLFFLILFCILLPNTAELTERHRLSGAGWRISPLAFKLRWRLNIWWAFAVGSMLGSAALLRLTSGGHSFIYFQF